MTPDYINGVLGKKEYRFKRLEFERGLGIVDDAFYLTFDSDSGAIVVKIITNLRLLKGGKTMVRYHDLFLKRDGKKISKKEYLSQRGIERTLLQTELDEANRLFFGERIERILFSAYGDMRVSLPNGASIIANDDLDVGKNGRRLYEILFLDTAKPFGVIASEHQKAIKITRKRKFTIFPEKDGCGLRFILGA